MDVTLAQGRLRGRATGGIAAFKGVPYACPPVGPLRWRPPVEAMPWVGMRDAGSFGPVCVQQPPGGDPGVGAEPMSEDCLTLNIWTPQERSGPMPVMVWIHGGGFHSGSGSAALYDGTGLARRGVVVVTLNYRLGRLGFFDHPALAAERAGGEPGGNYGLMDIVQALAWVGANIGAFGGDAGRVTVFGQSAGGAAVLRLMTTPKARGLFHRAIVQSGLGRERGTPLADPRADGGLSLQARGLAFAGPMSVEALRALPVERLSTPPPRFYTGDLFVRDGDVVAEDVEPVFAAGRQAAVPLIIGTTGAEIAADAPGDLSGFGTPDAAMTPVERADFAQACGGPLEDRAALLSDLLFNEPARHLARLHARRGHPTYWYRFDAASHGGREGGARHGAERAFVFDTLPPVGDRVGTRERALAVSMADYWTRFAASGDPNGSGQPDWPALTVGSDRLRHLTLAESPVTRDPFAERLDVVQSYVERIRSRGFAA